MAQLSDPRVPDRPAVVERQLQIALDNMPGALVYTDDKLDIVFCNDRFRELYPVPNELLLTGRPYPAFLRYLADNGYYGEGDPRRHWWHGGWRACATRQERVSRITRPMAGGCAFCGAACRQAARSP